MKKLIWTPKFLKSAENIITRHPELSESFKQRIRMLEDNPFNPALRTHKLKGPLSGYYACSLNYNYRIVFEIEKRESDELIILIQIGTHDEVY